MSKHIDEPSTAEIEESRRKLVNYIKRGVKKGFNTSYIRNILIKHGHHRGEVDLAIAAATRKPIPPSEKPGASTERFSYMMVGSTIVIVLLIIALVLALTTREPTVIAPDGIEISEESLQDYIDKIGEFGSTIDAKEAEIRNQLRTIKLLNVTIEEKQILIDAQLEEIDELYELVKEEREYTKSTVFELLDAILQR